MGSIFKHLPHLRTICRTSIVFALLSWCLVGCGVTPEKIQQWKTTRRGSTKLQTALKNEGVKLPLRVQSALALVEINETPMLVAGIRDLIEDDRERLVNELAASLIYALDGKGAPNAPAISAMKAKDALFSVRELFSAGKRAEIDSNLVDWLLEDWQARSGGDHSGKKIVLTIGNPAASILARRLAAQPQSAVAVALLLREVGDDVSRNDAVRRWIAWLEQRNTPAPRMLEPLGRVGGVIAREYLLKVANDKRRPSRLRIAALQALALTPHEDSVQALAAIAGGASFENGIRGAAFQALEAIESDATANKLAKIIATDKSETVRYRAVEAILACCKADGISQLLEALPTRYSYPEADVADFIERDIKQVGSKALVVLRRSVASSSWIARLISVRLLGELGSSGDLAAIRKLVNDKTKLKGWGPDATLGREAAKAAAQLKKRVEN